MDTVVNSSTQLTVTIPDIRALNKQVVAHFYVRNPDGSRSDLTTDLAFTFLPGTPALTPTLTSLSQNSVVTPTATFTFTVTGTNFVQLAGDPSGHSGGHTMLMTEEWGPLPTVVNSDTQLTVTMPAIRGLAKPVVAHFYVSNPGDVRSDVSTDLPFTFNPAP